MDLLIDTDPAMGTLGCDPEDCLAIAMALASPEVSVRAITCVQGNVPVRHSYANAAYLLSLLGRTDVPLAAGHERPLLNGREQLRWLAETDGYARVIPTARPPYPQPRAVELILDTARASDGLSIVALGPLTNLAAALLADPALVDRVGTLTVMGGAFEEPGNITPTAEFNFLCDPCSWGSTSAIGRISPLASSRRPGSRPPWVRSCDARVPPGCPRATRTGRISTTRWRWPPPSDPAW
jgi:inosine-uridine nucleoside N-ribohydrolase